MQERPRSKRAKKSRKPTTNSLSDYDASIQEVIENSIYEAYEPAEKEEKPDD